MVGFDRSFYLLFHCVTLSFIISVEKCQKSVEKYVFVA